MLPWMLSVYLFLLIFRPYEYWSWLGDLRIERIFMLFFLLVVFFSKDKRFVPSSINGAVLLFSLSMIFSSFFSIDNVLSSATVEDYLKYVVFYFLVILCVRDYKDFRLVVTSFVFVMLLYTGKSAWEFFVHGRHDYRMGIARMIGIDITYGDANSFAASICYSLPLSWALWRSRMQVAWEKYGLLAYGALALICIISSGSRSGMVTALLFLGLVFLGTNRKFVSFLLIALVLIFSWNFMSDDLHIRFKSTFTDEDLGGLGAANSKQGRMVGFLHGMNLFAENPVLGIGPGAFRSSWPGLSYGYDSHNLAGQLFGELGLIGAVAFMVLLGLIVFKNASLLRDYRRKFQFRSKECQQSVKISPQNEDVFFAPPNSTQNSPNIELASLQQLNAFVPSRFYSHVATAIIQTIILMIFKGWGDHNLYRYTWLWLAALTVLCVHLYAQEVQRFEST